MRRKLLDKGYDAAVINGLIERLSAEKLIDDNRFVENFVLYHASRGQGPLRVGAQLRKRGMHGPSVDEHLVGYADWLLQLRKAQQKKFGARAAYNYADRQRQARFFTYRGYTGAQIRAALGIDTDLDSCIEDL